METGIVAAFLLIAVALFAVSTPALAKKQVKVNAFSWANCGDGKDPAVIKSLSVKPDPVDIPGDLKASVSGSSAVDLSSPLTVNLTMEKEVAGIWVKIPCVEEIGSCIYKDVCDILDQLIPPGQNCPEPLFSYGIPCHCPFKAGIYTMPETDFFVPDLDLPYWLTNGNYKVTGNMTTSDRELACVELSFSIKSS